MSGRTPTALLLALAGLAAGAASALPAAQADPSLPTPTEFFGHEVGADYQLVGYDALTRYWEALAAGSDRMVLDTIGDTQLGRPQLMAIVTSPANHSRLEEIRNIATQLARADAVENSSDARNLAQRGRAVVWIDGGLHATETLGAQQLIETVYQFATRQDEETRRILEDVVILFAHANPDGHALVADWYMRENDPEERSLSDLPVLYQHYAGHDNNRDFYMANLAETRNMNRVMYREWYPQIVYNHHQTGPRGTVMYAPPFRGPANYHLDPIVLLGIDQLGSAMHVRFLVERKPGTVMRSAASYSTWWNGGLRTAPYFHNMIGLLTETIGAPAPIEIPYSWDRYLQTNDTPLPIEPQTWRMRQSVEYSLTANYAVLDYASRNREHLLYNIWRMGRNAIEAGHTDTWTVYPNRWEAARRAVSAEGGPDRADDDEEDEDERTTRDRATYERYFRHPDLRDARAYVISADQRDYPTATKFVNALIRTGVEVHRATAEFTLPVSALGAQAIPPGGRLPWEEPADEPVASADGDVADRRREPPGSGPAGRADRGAAVAYGAGSYVVFTGQAFRAQALDMFEPQDHPDDIPYAGAPPTAPYDNAGWTLAYQMGVEFDRILDGFTGPFERISGFAPVPRGSVAQVSGAPGYLIGHETNDAFVAVNRLLAAGHDVFWLRDSVRTTAGLLGRGAYYIPAAPAVLPILRQVATEKGLMILSAPRAPATGAAVKVQRPRVGLWDTYGGSMPSGWTRWLLEQFEFPFTLVYPPELDAGNLRARFDVIILPDGANIPDPQSRRGRRNIADATPPRDAPPEWRARGGVITKAATVPQLREFLEQGGRILAIGSATELAFPLGIPIDDALTDSSGKKLPESVYFIPGSVLEVRVDDAHPLAHGMPKRANMFFDDSPSFRLGRSAPGQGVTRVAWFDSPTPLRSGWAWGQGHLLNAAAIVEARVGEGTLVLYGPEVLFRAQPHGTFKLLFNGIHYGGAQAWR
ncbi:MAG TPA: M14 family metallopeptidase [Longimicrobiales bacterium]|nr:M14 family metallopeptidase [Longimicrobiales bacterium]